VSTGRQLARRKLGAAAYALEAVRLFVAFVMMILVTLRRCDASICCFCDDDSCDVT
jgi:hypothetical protein